MGEEARYQKLDGSPIPRQGITASVFRSKDTWNNDKEVVVKFTSFGEQYEKWAEEQNGRVVGRKTFKLVTLYREVKILRNLEHENVVSLLHCVRPPHATDAQDLVLFKEIQLVFESHPVNFTHILQRPGAIPLHLRKQYMYDILLGLRYIHSNGIIHRDMKPDNILVASDPNSPKETLKICDFGLSRAFGISSKNVSVKNATTEVVSEAYRPPEIWKSSSSYNATIDTFACGVMLAQMLQPEPSTDPTINAQFGRDLPIHSPDCRLFSAGHVPMQTAYELIMGRVRLEDQIPQTYKMGTDSDRDKYYREKLGYGPDDVVDVWKPFEDVYKRLSADETEYSLLCGLLNLNPADRLSSEDALKRPYFEGLFDASRLVQTFDISRFKIQHESKFKYNREGANSQDAIRLRSHYDLAKKLLYNELVSLYKLNCGPIPEGIDALPTLKPVPVEADDGVDRGPDLKEPELDGSKIRAPVAPPPSSSVGSFISSPPPPSTKPLLSLGIVASPQPIISIVKSPLLSIAPIVAAPSIVPIGLPAQPHIAPVEVEKEAEEDDDDGVEIFSFDELDELANGKE